MTTNAEDQIDTVAVLHDVMGNICKYLNRKELCNLAEVCKSWRDAALHERAKRYHIQQLRLFYKFGNLDSALDVEPYASLLIYDSKLENSLPLNKLYHLKKKVLKHFERKQPRKTIVLMVKECLTTEDRKGTKDQYELKVTRNAHCGILGLFFPNVKHRLRVRVAWKPGIRIVDLALFVAESFAEKLRLDDCKYPKSALLLFIEPNEPGAAMVASLLRDKAKSGNGSVWIAEVGGELVAANFHSRDHRKNKKKCIAAVRISGPTVQSWSECIDLRLPRDEVELKLHGLRERLTLRKHCTAMLAAPCDSAYGSSRRIMRTVKRIFPEIPFTGLFDSHNKTINAAENWWETMTFLVENYAHMSLIIITYD